MEKYNVDVYICGHDHNLQHLRTVAGNGLDFVVSGGGGAPLYSHRPANDLELMEVSSCQLFVDRFCWRQWISVCTTLWIDQTLNAPNQPHCQALTHCLKHVSLYTYDANNILLGLNFFFFFKLMKLSRVGPNIAMGQGHRFGFQLLGRKTRQQQCSELASDSWPIIGYAGLENT